jgi:signal transduction histidine kinase/ActR/RegA family two-component response regulator
MASHATTKNRLITPLILLLIFVVILRSPPPANIQAQENENKPHKVLVLHAYNIGFTWTDFIQEGIQSVFDETELDVELYVEYMDSKRYDPELVFPRLIDLYQTKYKDTEFDVIITSDDNAFNFILDHRDQLFPGVPVVFNGVNNFKDARLMGHTKVTGVTEDFDLRSTTDIILRPHPQTKQIVVISDVTPSGALNLERMRNIMPDYEDQVEFVELYQLTAEDLVDALHNLPEDTVVLNLSFWRDPTGKSFTHAESLPLIVDNFAGPVYTPWDHMIAYGTVGGMATNGRLQGKYAAQMAERILQGESANDIPIVYQSPNTPMFDYPALSRFGISVSDLPEGSIVMNEPETFYYRYKTIIWLVAIFVILQTAAIMALGINIIQRHRVEQELQDRNRELTLLNQVIAVSTTSLNIESVLETACREMARAFNVPQASATLVDQEESMTTIVAEFKGEDKPTILNQKVSLDNNVLAQYLIEYKAPLMTSDAQNDNRLASIHHLLRQRNAVSILILPLLTENKVIGTLSLATTQTRIFSSEEVRLGQRVANQVAAALARIQLDEQKHRLEELHRQGQKMEAIGRLAGGMAHDFNNLLTVITGYSELLLNRHMDDDDPQRRNVEQINRASERASRLTRQLLAFSRQQMIKPELLNLNDIITDLNKMLYRLVSENIEQITELDPTLSEIRADRGQIEQIIMNLTVNASDAMPQGGQLTTQTTNVQLKGDSAGLPAGSYVRLTISDTGIGMDAKTQARIFEPFFTTKDMGKGTGLGLATVYGIVRQNQGNITVSSRPGDGTSFEIFLPIFAGDEATAPQKKQGTADMPHGKETILLVEDEDMVRDLAHYALQQNGYTILEAPNGQQALKLCQDYQKSIDLLLTDVVMPGGLSGPDLAGQVSTIRPNIKVLYVSGYVDNEIVKHGVLDADVEFLQKPFSPVALAHKVRNVLDQNKS